MDKWILCVFALVLGMIMFHMLKSVCRCKSDVVEGVDDEYGCTTETADAGECNSGSKSFLDQLGIQSTDIPGDEDKCEPLKNRYNNAYVECINGSEKGEKERNGLCKDVTDATDAIAAEKLARGTAEGWVEDRPSHRLTVNMDSVMRKCAGPRCCYPHTIVPPGLRFSAFCHEGYWKVIKDGVELGECMDKDYNVFIDT